MLTMLLRSQFFITTVQHGNNNIYRSIANFRYHMARGGRLVQRCRLVPLPLHLRVGRREHRTKLSNITIMCEH